MKRSNRQKLVIFLAAATWLIVFFATLGRFQFAARSPMTVLIKSSPREVRIRVDNENHKGGRYVKTPLELEMGPGKHRLKISREGYVSHVMTVEGGSGDKFHMEDVVLGRNPRFTFVAVTVEAEGDELVHFVINDGQVEGDTPATFDELVAGEAHTLAVYPEWPDKEKAFRCRFTIKEDETSRTISLQGVKKGRIKADGCRRLRKRARKDKTGS